MNGTNPKRMYVVENTRDFVRAHDLQQGSILSFYYASDGRLVRLHDAPPVLSSMSSTLCVAQPP